MISNFYSMAIIGLDAHEIRVEVDISNGLPKTTVVGLPDKAVNESKERIYSALSNSGFEYPCKKVTINLAPGDLRKEGSLYDLPIATGIISAMEYIEIQKDKKFYLAGELSLDGIVRKTNGILSMASKIAKVPNAVFILPYENKDEALLAENITIYPVKTLYEAVEALKGEIEPIKSKTGREIFSEESTKYDVDFSDVKGQKLAKRAIETAASGNHNLLMIGPPGSGKTMLARRIPTILPPMTYDEAFEVTKIYSVKGLLPKNSSIIRERPFRSPHHSLSYAGLIGGGSIPAPGEISFAHRGVLFLDELPEFERNILEMLRQPLEDGKVLISRVKNSIIFPASFMLIAAMNPCPCGYYGDPTKKCECSPLRIKKYMSRISGPILDRIDINTEVARPESKYFSSTEKEESSEEIRKRVEECRELQMFRFKKEKFKYNSEIPAGLLSKVCKTTSLGEKLLYKTMDSLGFTARAYGRILRLARTLADMEKKEIIDDNHIAEAIQYRIHDRKYF